MTTTGSLAGTLGLFQPFRYRGYVYDWETGFYYLQSRYYDPTTGRFISADVLLSTGQGVMGHNCYAYCLDDPINMVDYSGDLPSKVIIVVSSNTEDEDDQTTEDIEYSVTIMYMEYEAFRNGILFPRISIGFVKIKFSITPNGIVRINNFQQNIEKIERIEIALALATEIIRIARLKNPNYLKDRTVIGVTNELLVHYYLKHLYDNARITDIGGVDPNVEGYDENAYIFEDPFRNIDAIIEQLIY